ncbi:MAG: LysR family transcriptional regulator, low CO2-responsive transcriptional regulator [Rhodospirillaceae bacterium]|nr:LysR family transcriptional regulator, low CO2-responsive transcriptional regulator [Rhodospirillaceae bacterium]
MNHAHLRAFHAVASEGSFTRAAARLHVTQPTLSGQVKALEETYGVRLFDRRGRRVAPTELGSALLDLTRRLFSLEDEAEQLLAATRGLRKGHLRVGADAPYHVTAALSAFTKRYPGVQLSLTVGNSAALARELFEHKIDVAVLANVAGGSRLHAKPLRRDRLVAFVARTHPWARRRRIDLADLADQRLVLREQGSATRQIFETEMARRGLALGEVLDMNSREAVRETVAAGLGIGVVSVSEFGRDPRIKALELAGGDLTMIEYIVCLAERRDLRLISAFLRIVEQAAD